MNPKLRILRLVLALCFLVVSFFSAQYPYLTAAIWLGYWACSSWIDIIEGQGFLQTRKQKLLTLLVTVIFLLYCLPAEIRFSPFSDFVKGFFIAFLLADMFSGGGGGGKRKRPAQKVSPEKLRWRPQAG